MRNKHTYCIHLHGNLRTIAERLLPKHDIPQGIFYTEGSKPSRALQKLLEKETGCGGREAGIATTTITAYIQDYSPYIFDIETWYEQEEKTRKKEHQLPFDKQSQLARTLVEKLGGTKEDYEQVIETYITKKE